jgi:predicted  nucleic acid-binding Zn-ribbon protein
MAVAADDDALKNLLEVQSEDSEIERLTQRRASFPEAAQLAEVNAQLEELDADLVIARKQLEEITREQNRLEGEIELLTQKIGREEGRLFSGGVSNPKELSALQEEVASLKRRSGGLEDELLEVMVHRDSSNETIQSLEGERSTAAGSAEELTAKVAELTSEIETALAEHSARRAEVASGVPADLLKLYAGLRDSKQGIGAAALVGDTCQGCHTALPAREVERLRAEKGLQRCENCRRILVVT